MSRKQFLILVIALVVLGAAGGAIWWSQNSAWNKSDARAGQNLLPQLKLIDIAQVVLHDGQSQTTMTKDGADWKIKERADFPADSGRLAELLNKTASARVTQVQPVSAQETPGFVLVDPDDKSQKAEQGTGTVLELKDKDGKQLARLVLGKPVIKKVTESPAPGEPPKEMDKEVGRHLVMGSDAGTLIMVNEGLAQASAKPADWVTKPVLHIDRTKSVTTYGPDNGMRYGVTRKEEGDWWNFPDGGPRPDQQKAQDSVSPLYEVTIVDVAPDASDADTGLDKPITAKAETFDRLSYTLKLGKKIPGAKPGDDRYYARFSISGEPPMQRESFKGETKEDIEKKGKEWVGYREKLMEQVKREQNYSKWTFILPARPVEPLLRSKAEMMPDKKPAPAKK